MQVQSTLPTSRTCQQCGRPFTVAKPSQQRQFCSKRCYGDSMVVKVSRQCDQCEAPYSVRRDVFEAGMGRYCSKSCSNRGRALPFAQRFWALVGPADENGCRDWQGACDKDGYGLVTLPGGGQQMAHRAAYELAHGPLGDLKALHHCDRPPCCEPAHLFKGTHQANSDDKLAKDRHYHKLTDDAVREILRDLALGVPVIELAIRHNVTTGAIYPIRDRKTWRHIN
jgi:hypothetical protein